MAQQPIYVEPDEELTEVVERLRRAEGAEVAIVLPGRARLGQSRFNFQLLREYAGRMGKTVAIISPEAGVQALAAEHGFSTFATVDGYLPGAGVYAPAPRSEYAPVVTAVAAPAASGTAVAAPPAPRPAPAVRPAAKPSPLEGFRDREIFGARPNRTLLYGGAALVLLVGLVAMFLFVPSATITLTTQAQAFSQPLDISAAPGSGPVAIRVADDQQQASQSFKTTGEKVTPAQPATGQIVYTNSCPPPFNDVIVPNGQRVDGQGQQFAQNSGDVEVKNGSPATATVIATTPGTAGNVPAHAINTIEGESSAGSSCLSVDNPQPTTGGAAQKQDPMLSQQDLDGARGTLQTNLKSKIQSDLAGEAKSGEKLDATVNYDTPAFLSDHKVGDLVQNFTGSMTLKGEGAFYSDGDVRNQLTQNLVTKVPSADTTVPGQKIDTTYQVSSSQPGGHLTFHGTASGYIAPRLDEEQISAQLAGKSYSAALDFLRTLPVRGSTIDQSPFPLPLLPIMTSRIFIHYRVDVGQPAST